MDRAECSGRRFVKEAGAVAAEFQKIGVPGDDGVRSRGRYRGLARADGIVQRLVQRDGKGGIGLIVVAECVRDDPVRYGSVIQGGTLENGWQSLPAIVRTQRTPWPSTT